MAAGLHRTRHHWRTSAANAASDSWFSTTGMGEPHCATVAPTFNSTASGETTAKPKETQSLREGPPHGGCPRPLAEGLVQGPTALLTLASCYAHLGRQHVPAQVSERLLSRRPRLSSQLPASAWLSLTGCECSLSRSEPADAHQCVQLSNTEKTKI